MDHRTATRSNAAARYFLDELSESERNEFEEHYFSCVKCGAEIQQGALLLGAARPVLVDLPPLRRPSVWTSSGAWKLAAGIGFASLIGVSGYQRVVEIPRLQSELEATQALRAVPSYFLAISRGEPPVLDLSRDDRFVVLTLSQSSDRRYPAYRCELQDAGGRTLRTEVLPAPPADELQVLLPVTDLLDGRYTLALQGVANGATSAASGTASISSYGFNVRRR